jgi:hypothetical protein
MGPKPCPAMTEDKSMGASYLTALKQTVPQTSGAAAARAPAGEARGMEKRRSPRFRCQGSVHLRDLKTKVSTWATFTDISLHGCYVEAMSTFTAGSELALTLEVNGFRVTCYGTVQVVYPGLGMGLSFTTMSQENREHLRQLMQTLSRPSSILGAGSAAATIPQVPSENSSQTVDAAAALQAIKAFFEERQVLGREEFLRILRKHQR